MSIIHKFKNIKNNFTWNGVENIVLKSDGINGAQKSILVGNKEGAKNFIMRYIELAPGGHSNLERHMHEHEVIILNGNGVVQIGEKQHKVYPFDAVFIEGNELHQFSNPYANPFGFICVIPKLEQ